MTPPIAVFLKSVLNHNSMCHVWGVGSRKVIYCLLFTPKVSRLIRICLWLWWFNINISFSLEDLANQWGNKVVGYRVRYRSRQCRLRQWESVDAAARRPRRVLRPARLLPSAPVRTWKRRAEESGLVGYLESQDECAQHSTWTTLNEVVHTCYRRTSAKW